MIIRPATPADAPAMADLLNRIIAIGGTTAHQNRNRPKGFWSITSTAPAR